MDQKDVEEKTNISSSEFYYETTLKFDESGDNTIHVLLRSLLTIVEESGQMILKNLCGC